MKILRKQFSNIDWKKVKEDLEVGGSVGLLSSIFGSYFLKEKLGLSKKASIIGGIGAGIGAAALTYKLLGHDSYKLDNSEERNKKIESASKQFPWIKDILGNLPKEYSKIKIIEGELKKNPIYLQWTDGADPGMYTWTEDEILAQVLKCIEENKNPVANIFAWVGCDCDIYKFSYDFKTKTISCDGKNVPNVKGKLLEMLGREASEWSGFTEGDEYTTTDEIKAVKTYTNKQIELVKKYL